MSAVAPGRASPPNVGANFTGKRPISLSAHLAWLSVAFLAGCGHASTVAKVTRPALQPPPAVCSAAARKALAGSLRVGAGGVRGVAGTSNGGSPQCLFAAGRVRVTAILDSGPQPYFRLERTAVEATQVFGAVRVEPTPTPIAGLGIDAWWFPGERRVMTTDGTRLITVNVSWPGETQSRRRALAVALARAYLGPLQPKAADPNGS